LACSPERRAGDVTSTLVLVALFREFWAVVSHKTPVTVADLDRVERSAQRMLQRFDAARHEDR